MNYNKNYVRLYKIGCGYARENESISLLEDLARLFDDHGSGVEWLTSELLDQNSRGISGELTRVNFFGNKVVLEPTLVDNPEDYSVEIDRDVLLRLANEWQELVEKRASVIFIVNNNGHLSVTDVLPAGME